MTFWCNEKFWIEDYRELFCNVSTIPEYQTPMNVQLNALSRLVILISILLLFVSKTLSLVFLIMSFLFIILIYYIQRDKMRNNSSNQPLKQDIIEHFNGCSDPSNKKADDKSFYVKEIDSNLEYYELDSQPCRRNKICNKIENVYIEQYAGDEYNQNRKSYSKPTFSRGR